MADFDVKELLDSLSEDELRELLASLEGDGEGDEEDDVSRAVDEVTALLDEHGIKYVREGERIVVPFGGPERVIIQIVVQGLSGAQLRSSDLVCFGHDARQRALELVSELNSKYRFAKFCLDDDDTAHVEMDVPSCNEANYEVMLELLMLAVRICQEALPRLSELAG